MTIIGLPGLSLDSYVVGAHFITSQWYKGGSQNFESNLSLNTLSIFPFSFLFYTYKKVNRVSFFLGYLYGMRKKKKDLSPGLR